MNEAEYVAMGQNSVDHSATTDGPSSRELINPTSTSANLPTDSEVEVNHASPQTYEGNDSKREEAVPTPSSTSATLPISQEPEDQETAPEPEATAAPKTPKKKVFSTAEHKTAFLHFVRIFSYSTRGDKLLLFAASVASICTGVTLPLMNVVFGKPKHSK